MKFSKSFIATVLASYTELVLALPQPQTENLQALYPASINCGANDGSGNLGLPNVSPPDYGDLSKAASRLAKQGGVCTGATGDGQCIRVACDNTTGIWLCNTDGAGDGPFSPQCSDVAAYVYRGEGDGVPAKDIYNTCKNPAQYSITISSGQAFDESGNWNVITGYANCGHPPTNPPDAE